MDKYTTYFRRRYVSHIKDPVDPVDFGYVLKGRVYDDPETCESTLLNQSKVESVEMMDGSSISSPGTSIPVMFYVEKDEGVPFVVPSHYKLSTEDMMSEFFMELEKAVLSELGKVFSNGFDTDSIKRHDNSIDSIKVALLKAHGIARRLHRNLVSSKLITSFRFFRSTSRVMDDLSLYIKARMLKHMMNPGASTTSVLESAMKLAFKDIVNGSVPSATSVDSSSPFVPGVIVKFVPDEPGVMGSTWKWVTASVKKIDTSVLSVIKMVNKDFGSSVDTFVSTVNLSNCIVVVILTPKIKFVGSIRKDGITEKDGIIEFETVAPTVEVISYSKTGGEVTIGKVRSKAHMVEDKKSKLIVFHDLRSTK